MIPRPPRSTLFPYTTLFQSESLLLPQAGVLGDVDHDGPPVEQPLVGAALDDPRALLDGLLEHRVAAVALALVDHRAEADLAGRRVAHGDVARALGERLHVVVVELPRDEVPAGGDAGLALVVVRRPGADHRRLLEVGVLEHHERVVAAELQRALLQLLPTHRRDLAADRARAREVDHLRALVG